MIMVYHVYIERDGEEKWIALGLLGEEQAHLLGEAFPEITRIETWLGNPVYERKTVH